MARIGRDQLERLQRTYHTDAAIAALYGITRQAVQRLRTRYGLPSQPVPRGERDAAIVAMRSAGASVSRIARRHKLSETHIYRILRGITVSGPLPL